MFRSVLRRGLTLVELLVVMGVLSLLAAIALPNIKVMIQQQRISRSASAVQSYIDAARAKAISSGQSYGVIIERSGVDSLIGRSQSVRLRFAYSPPDYSGDVPEAVAVVLPSGNLAFSPSHAPTLVASATQRVAQQNGTGVDPIVRPLDLIQVGGISVTLPIEEIRFAKVADFAPVTGTPTEYVVPGFVPDSSGSFRWPENGLLPNATQIAGWPVIVLATPSTTDFDAASRIRRVLLRGTTVPFRIIRRPRASILTPLDITDGTVIDLNYSGIGIGNFDFAPAGIELSSTTIDPRAFHEGPYTNADPAPDYGPVTIMFDSQGSVSDVYYASSGIGEYTVDSPFPTVKLPPIRQDARSNIFLLLGRSGNVRSGDVTNGLSGSSGPLGADQSGIANIFDLETVWIVINRQTGEVFTSDVNEIRAGDGSLLVTGATPPEVLRNAITLSQYFAANFYEGGR